jgi:hypothetical protein
MPNVVRLDYWYAFFVCFFRLVAGRISFTRITAKEISFSVLMLVDALPGGCDQGLPH